MDNQSTDGVILQAAWKLLWTSGTPYYLPDVMRNGLKWNNIDIPALEGSSVDKLGPISLFKNDALGYISLTMNNSSVNGLPSITNGGLTYDDNTHTITISIGFGELDFNGRYEVDSGGITGCAIDAANKILNIFQVAAGEVGDDPNIDLAYQYRDRLTQADNPNGNTLVDMFYNQNDTLNTVVLAQNATVNGKTNKTNGLFHNAWLNHTTQGKDTAYYMKVTASASKEPDDPNTEFNDDDYNMHGFYMEVMLTQEAVALKNLGDPRGDALYNSIYENAVNNNDTSLLSEAQSYNGNNVNNFMGYVHSGGSQTMTVQELGAARERKLALYEKAKAKALSDYEDWIANDRHEEYAANVTPFAKLGDISQIRGSFSDTFTTPSIEISATVATQNDYLVVDITDLKASVPNLHIELHPTAASELNNQVQNAIANMGFLQDLLKAKIEKALGADNVKSYLTDRINQAIQRIFG